MNNSISTPRGSRDSTEHATIASRADGLEREANDRRHGGGSEEADSCWFRPCMGKRGSAWCVGTVRSTSNRRGESRGREYRDTRTRVGVAGLEIRSQSPQPLGAAGERAGAANLSAAIQRQRTPCKIRINPNARGASCLLQLQRRTTAGQFQFPHYATGLFGSFPAMATPAAREIGVAAPRSDRLSTLHLDAFLAWCHFESKQADQSQNRSRNSDAPARSPPPHLASPVQASTAAFRFTQGCPPARDTRVCPPSRFLSSWAE